MIVGIDIGSCFTKISVMIGDEIIDSFITNEVSEGIPTRFAIVDGKEYCGDQLIDKNVHSDNIIEDIKTSMRVDTSGQIRLSNKTYPCRQVLESYLTYIYKRISDAAEEYGSDIDLIVMTVPTSKNDKGMATEYNRTLRETMQSVSHLPLESILIKEEPIAAAAAYIKTNNVTKDQKILVFDLGGSTLDLAAVEWDSEGFKVIYPDGMDLGARQWDSELSNLIMNAMGMDSFTDPIEQFEFGQVVIDSKKSLSTSDSIEVSFKNYYRYNLEREDFERDTRYLLCRAEDILKTVLKKCGRQDVILLVGGGSNMPQIKRMVRQCVPKETEIVLYTNPKAVSTGAAILGNPEVASIYRYKGVSSHTYGVDVHREGRSNEMLNLIFKGDPIVGDYLKVEYNPSSGYPLSVRTDDQNAKTMVLDFYETDITREECDDSYCSLDLVDKPSILRATIQIPPEMSQNFKADKYVVNYKVILDSNSILTPHFEYEGKELKDSVNITRKS